jgi:hypothetical protein
MTLYAELTEFAQDTESEVGAAVLSLIRPSIGLAVAAATRPLPDDRVASCYGGLPRLGERVTWPEYDDRPLVLLAQLDCAELAAALTDEWTLPADGLLLFFYDDDFAGDFAEPGENGCRVLHVPADGPVRQAPPQTLVIPALPLAATFALSVPDYTVADLADHMSTDWSTVMGLTYDLRELVPSARHRVLGWCDTIVCGPAGHRPLLQLEPEQGTAWGECVNISFWIREDDLRIGRLDRVRSVLEVA